ncbi:MAG TPA: 2-hydroxyacid dehydrogenase [Terracidiphilus sp.]|nr:2-hydroxyacid dehydrogenase [Terracidiphilus sp.]
MHVNCETALRYDGIEERAPIERMNRMLRVGYPATLPAELFRDFPSGIDLIPVSDKMDHDVAIDVWIPDPYSTKAIRTWPRLRGVKLVLAMMAGTEWIPETVGPHVTICRAHGAHNISTAEWTIAAILATLKYFPLYFDIQRSGIWKRRFEASAQYAAITGDTHTTYPPVLQEELTGKTVLLVGYGAIGQEIERMLEPFSVEIIRVARSARTSPQVHAVSELDTLLPHADVVILILPATAESRGLIGERQLGLLHQGALLVNSARGPIADTDALVKALNSGRIRAALDVTEPEPLPEGHPLWSCPNLLITPHIGGSTPQFAPRSLRVAADELQRYINGEPLRNVVQQAS